MKYMVCLRMLGIFLPLEKESNILEAQTLTQENLR
jgi:hypothetical protein